MVETVESEASSDATLILPVMTTCQPWQAIWPRKRSVHLCTKWDHKRAPIPRCSEKLGNRYQAGRRWVML